jgi:general secretion pathway protein E
MPRQDDDGHWHPVGCAALRHTGYKGRTGVYELMVVNDAMRALIHNRAASRDWSAARAAGMRSMREDGERLVRETGITSAEEVVRVTRD